jgi:hypothetical protein
MAASCSRSSIHRRRPAVSPQSRAGAAWAEGETAAASDALTRLNEQSPAYRALHRADWSCGAYTGRMFAA